MAVEPSARSTGFGLAPKLLVAFAAQAVVAVVGIVTVPIYLHLMGPEAYGLTGFYVALQGWMVLLDLGLSPTLTRQLSRFRAGALTRAESAGLVRLGELLFAASGLIVAALFAFFRGWIANRWLRASHIPLPQVSLSVALAGALIGTRWLGVLYHAVLTGLERQISLNAILLTAALARAAATVIALNLLGPSPVVFFNTQFLFSALEALSFRIVFMSELAGAAVSLRKAWRSLGAEWHFAASLAIAAGIWVAVTQVDKVALSHFLTLQQYGYFSLTIAICGGISMLAPPVFQMSLPRLTALLARDQRDAFIQLYRLCSSLVIVVAVATAGTIAAHPDLVFLAWTGNRQATELGWVLTLYAMGTGFSLYVTMPYQLQFAEGSLRLHLLGSAAFGAVWIPSAILAAWAFGAVGAGAIWLIGNVLLISIWAPTIHHRFLSPAERRHVFQMVLPKSCFLALLVAVTALVPTADLGRGGSFAFLAFVASTVVVVGVLMFDDLRMYLLDFIGKARAAVSPPN